MIDPALAAKVGDWIFGCDVCQEVCPHNEPTDRTREVPVHEAYATRHHDLDLAEVLGWTEEDRRRVFAGSALKRAKLGMMRRNAVIVAGNALSRGDQLDLRSLLTAIAADDAEDEIVRQAARNVLRSVPDLRE